MRAILLATLLALVGAATLAPTATAGDTCTMYTGCLDTCNMQFCLSTGPLDETIDEVEGIVDDYPQPCFYRLCPNLP